MSVNATDPDGLGEMVGDGVPDAVAVTLTVRVRDDDELLVGEKLCVLVCENDRVVKVKEGEGLGDCEWDRVPECDHEKV